MVATSILTDRRLLRESHEVDHAARAFALATVGVVQVGAAHRAIGDVVDVAGRESCLLELPDVGGAHVEVGLAARPGPEELSAVRTELPAQLLSDLVAA